VESAPARDIRACVTRVRRRWRLLQAGEELSVLTSLVLAFLLLGLGVDVLQPVLPYAGAVFSLSFLAAVAVRAVPLTRALFGPIPQRRVLSRIEQCYPHLNTNLISAVEIPRQIEARGNLGNASIPLVEALVAVTGRQIRDVEARSVLSARGVLRWGSLSALLLGAVLVVLALDAPSLGRSASHLLHPLRSLSPVGVEIAVHPEGGTVARGAPVVITAQVSGRVVRTAALRTLSDGQQAVEHAMEVRADGVFLYRIAEVQAPFDYEVVAGGHTSRRYHMAILDLPQIGNVVLELRYPAYTGLPAHMQYDSGHITAYKGTEVLFRAESSRELARASIVTGVGRVPLTIEGGVALGGTMVVLEPGEYWVEAEDTEGFSNPDPVRYTIAVIPDEAPVAEIVQPTGDVTLEEEGVLNLEFTAQDDFGVSRLFLVCAAGSSSPGEEERSLLRRSDPPTNFLRETYPWDLAGLGLQPGEVVTYWVEAEDNDTISGPKVGKSRALTVRIRSAQEEHRLLEGDLEKVRDLFLSLLGDQLELVLEAEGPLREAADGEGPSAEALERMAKKSRQVEQAASSLLPQVNDLLQGLADDPLSDSSVYLDVSALRARLESVQGALLPRAQEELSRWAAGPPQEQRGLATGYGEVLEEVTGELEQLALLADAIGKSQRMGDLWGLGERLQPMQDDLLTALEAMREGMDPAKLQEVEQQLRQLQEVLGEMMMALADLAGAIPDDFLNTQALRTLELGDLASALEGMREKLARGDVEGALAQARQMIQAMAETLAMLQELERQAKTSAQALEGAVEQSAEKLERLLEEQGDILAETSSVEKRVSDAVSRKLEEVVTQRRAVAERDVWELGSRLEKLLGEISRHSPGALSNEKVLPLARELAQMKQRLSERDLSTLGEFASRIREQLDEISPSSEDLQRADGRTLKGARDQVDGLLFDLERLADELGSLADWQKSLSPQDREKLGSLSQREDRLAEETEGLREAVEELSSLFPMVDRRISQELERAVESMGEAGEQLSSMNASGAVPAEREALFHLSRSDRALKEARQQAGQRQLMLGMSAPMMLRAGEGQQGPSPQLRPGITEQEGGRLGASHRDFAIPSEEDYQVPKLYREDVLEALREEYPASFKEAVERYFKNITE